MGKVVSIRTCGGEAQVNVGVFSELDLFRSPSERTTVRVNMAVARVSCLFILVLAFLFVSGNDELTECPKGFFLTEPMGQDEKPQCEPCDKSCLSFCRAKGPKGCEVCRDGYSWDPDYGCLDIDECHELGYDPCQRNSFCINTEGMYDCFGKYIKRFCRLSFVTLSLPFSLYLSLCLSVSFEQSVTKPAMDVMVMDRTFAKNVLLDTSW